MEELDVLAPCPDADAKTFRPWTPAEAVSRLRACLAKVYPQPDAAGVTSEGGKDAKTLVVLLKGPQSMEDAGRLRAAIKRRHGKLYGYPVIVKMAGATSPRSSPPSKAT